VIVSSWVLLSFGVLLHICKLVAPSPADHFVGNIIDDVLDSLAFSSGRISRSLL